MREYRHYWWNLSAIKNIPSDNMTRWVIISFILIISLCIFKYKGILFGVYDLADFIARIIFVVIFGLTVGSFRPKNMVRLKAALPAVEDYCLSISQLAFLMLAATCLTYCAAGTNFPLIDGWLLRFDSQFGVDRGAIDRFLSAHSWAGWLALGSYESPVIQVMVLALLDSWRADRNRNFELVWLFLICLLLDSFFMAIAPARSMETDPLYLQHLATLRAGTFRVFDTSRTTGMIAFPSFHAAAAIIFIYVARRTRWLFPFFVLLNLVMLAATVPMGGHYLADVVAGIGSTIIVIVLLERLRSSRSRQAGRAAGPLPEQLEPVPAESG